METDYRQLISSICNFLEEIIDSELLIDEATDWTYSQEEVEKMVEGATQLFNEYDEHSA